MDILNLNTKPNKGIHLNYDERMFIQIRLQDGWSAYKIAKELGRVKVKKNLKMNLKRINYGKKN